MKIQTFSLTGKWRLQQLTHSKSVSIEATVPGVVHQDLLVAGLIEDPFYRMNEEKVQWIENEKWQYSRCFELSLDWLQQHQSIELVCDGLDTFAQIRLNGKRVGETENMFHPWRFEVKNLLEAGTNEITIIFDSAVSRARVLAEAYPVKLRAGEFKPRVFIRKAQYAGGWDWGPRLMTAGIWRPIYLQAFETVKIRHVGLSSKIITEKQAQVTWDVTIESLAKSELDFRFELSLGEQIFKIDKKFKLQSGSNHFTVTQSVDSPQLWWPVGEGDQPLYDANLHVCHSTEIVGTWQGRLGIRVVKLLREPDTAGESFIFEVNGRKIFCKGADWIPADSFLPRVSKETYRKLLNEAVAANMNMLRIWGGGIYEDPAFYDICDELGLMVWQDFMFACGEYPEADWFFDLVRREASEVVLQLRNHPCLVLWCGNNEIHWQFGAGHPETGIFYGETVYEKILPEIVQKLDPARPYWPGSPYGGPNPNHPGYGNHHQWDVWSGWEVAEKYRENRARFISEFGFQSAPGWPTVKKFTDPADRFLFSETMEWHNKQLNSNPRLYMFLLLNFRATESLEEFVYLSQIVQAEAIKTGVEHWRSLKFHTAGTLFWQFNDCWPAQSWACIDYYHGRKALWYFALKFYAPVLVCFRPVSDGLEVWGVNDEAQAVVADLALSMLDFSGNVKNYLEKSVTLASNSSQKIAFFSSAEMAQLDQNREFIWAGLMNGQKVISENAHFLNSFKYLALPEPHLKIVVKSNSNGYEITVSAENFAKFVQLESAELAGQFSQNFFDILPGQYQTIYWHPNASMPTLTQFTEQLYLKYYLATGMQQLRFTQQVNR